MLSKCFFLWSFFCFCFEVVYQALSANNAMTMPIHLQLLRAPLRVTHGEGISVFSEGIVGGASRTRLIWNTSGRRGAARHPSEPREVNHISEAAIYLPFLSSFPSFLPHVPSRPSLAFVMQLLWLVRCNRSIAPPGVSSPMEFPVHPPCSTKQWCGFMAALPRS